MYSFLYIQFSLFESFLYYLFVGDYYFLPQDNLPNPRLFVRDIFKLWVTLGTDVRKVEISTLLLGFNFSPIASAKDKKDSPVAPKIKQNKQDIHWAKPSDYPLKSVRYNLEVVLWFFCLKMKIIFSDKRIPIICKENSKHAGAELCWTIKSWSWLISGAGLSFAFYTIKFDLE